ncbi:myo-inosose-2 dehydratase [Legionella shakespearei]|uniref:Myo-inositol catabolism protein iolE n=1 Tax=Legionella shakespearei DSM 23087 TaxID=1122169 RepID=A0A0W0YUD6_9GAMM|nr:myo-inosose-2 dehydratase [Legionella shakespearei]KTD60485.1 myo-inositol catabolism protein iolE [Legionella shakespearei DSM 23087]
MDIKLGIAPINWCNDDDPNLGKEISFEQCISEMARAGYTGTELGNKYPREISVLKEALSYQGLQLSSAWFSTYFTESERHDETLSRFLEHLSFMKAMGAEFINICECGHAIQGADLPVISPHKPEFSETQWRSLIQGIHTLGRIAHDHQMNLVYHYHAGTGVYSENEIDYLMEHTSPALLSLLLDTGHAVFAGVDPLSLVRKYGERIRYVHLKDIRAEVLQQVESEQMNFMDAVRAGVFTVPGDGCIDFAPVLNALREYQYKGWMIVEAEQDPAKAPPLEYAQKAMEYLKPLVSD